jgi:predicted MFS family arabinose efflux permease
MLLILDILGACIALFFILAYQFQSIPGLYATTIFQMTIAAMYEPARSALVPMLISSEGYLKKALTLTGLTWSVMACVGASTGGLVTEYFGINMCFLIDSVTYLLSAFFVWRIRGGYIAVKTSDESTAAMAPTEETTNAAKCSADDSTHLISMSEALKMTFDGFTYLKLKHWGAFVFLKGCAGLIYGAAEILNVAFSERNRGTNDTGTVINLEGSSGRLGVIFASVGVGCFIGPIISERLTDMEKPRSLENACLVSYALMAMGYFGLAQIEGFISVCLSSSIRAAGSSIVWIYSSLLLQVRTYIRCGNYSAAPAEISAFFLQLLQKFCSNNMLGRVMALDYALATLSEAIAAMAAGLLQDDAELTPESVSFIMALIAVITLFMWALYFCRVQSTH